jgi:hypothetical protein
MEKIMSITEKDFGRTGEYAGQSGYEVVTNKQVIELRIDDEQNCCEHWGYFWCNDNPQDFVGAKLLDIRLTDDVLNEAHMEVDHNSSCFEGGIMFVDIVTNIGVLQFVAYNEHNGYYGHEAVVKSTFLSHNTYL